ncbi:PEP-CTERM sorting domain-containing protein [Synechococcus sp. PCC 7336]|uniref:PEP-CTERM sorting domain-containing protein n=1 Tax=Synechococcus sp. PCC 7336 TaxID=195250 RepID=UPI00034928A2|nr:PEP-CTERM sorting domain-containing protein [Synechococcus sp. PCC 7336]
MSIKTARAAQLTFDFRVQQPDQTSVTFADTSGTLDVVATAFLGPLGSPSLALVNPTPNGLGIDNGDAPNSGVGDSVIDGPDSDNAGEFLVLDFEQAVRLTSATFFTGSNPLGTGAQNDNFTLFVDGVLSVDQFLLAPANTPTVTFGLSGQQFIFTATGANDNFQLSELVVVPIPEPITLLGTAIAGGLGWAYRRKHSNSKAV